MFYALSGRDLRVARAMAYVTQAELAERAGVSLETVKRLEGVRGVVNANMRTLSSLVAVFGELGIVFDHSSGQVLVRTLSDATGARVAATSSLATAPESEPWRAKRAADAGVTPPLARRLLDKAPGMLGYWDNTLRCRFSNPAYKEWFGRTPEQMDGIGAWELLGEKLFEMNLPYFRAALAGEAQAFERVLVKPTGQTGLTWAQYVPDHDDYGKVQGVIAMVTDITARAAVSKV